MAEEKKDGIPDMLRQAGRLIERAIVQLDMREYACLECGTKHFTNTNHARLYQQFTDTPGKLSTAADRFENEAQLAAGLPKGRAARQAQAALVERKEVEDLRRSEAVERAAPWEGIKKGGG